MSTTNVERLRQEIEALSADERRQLLDWILNASPEAGTETDDSRERVFQEKMLREGVIDNIPSGSLVNDFEPVVVRGRPLSETLIEDREPR